MPPGTSTRELSGKELPLKGDLEKVWVHGFNIAELGRGDSYGIYDIANSLGWVNVGIDHDTSTFAVESMRGSGYSMEKELYPNASNLMVTADGGGSNGYRVRLWKLKLQELADEMRLSIHVSQFAPGTSEWNKIEHGCLLL